MYRLLNVNCSRLPNTIFRKGDLVAMQDIRRGDCIRVPMPKNIPRAKEDRKEINRLARESYKFAVKN